MAIVLKRSWDTRHLRFAIVVGTSSKVIYIVIYAIVDMHCPETNWKSTFIINYKHYKQCRQAADVFGRDLKTYYSDMRKFP